MSQALIELAWLRNPNGIQSSSPAAVDAMRGILIDRARRKAAAKRGGDW
jgi:ECF sigma factor